MVKLVKKLFRKKEEDIAERAFNRIMSTEQISLIKKEWSKYPVNLDIQYCKSFDDIASFPRTSQKNNLTIGIISWEVRGIDVIIYTKHNVSGEHVLDTTIENLNREQLTQLGLLPIENKLICTCCNEFSTNINIESKCEDCL